MPDLEDTLPVTTASSVPHWTAEVVDGWFASVMNELPAVAMTTWNCLVAAKDELKRRLEKENN